ncbi:hypothetical protein D3C78_1751930 [compost metagenome]
MLRIPRHEIGRWHGPRKQISLNEGHAARGQIIELLLRFDAFGHHRQIQTMRQRNDHVEHRRVFPGRQNRVHEALVDLQIIHRKLLQVRQRAMAGAEIINGHAHARRA